jgi:hypothetical protein
MGRVNGNGYGSSSGGWVVVRGEGRVSKVAKVSGRLG